ncbi:Carbonate dehydratase [Alteripontixanthobacter maritimus]|uniref:carbonic anhydrase n=1 Tax=Alteripontixanthobacter maritimus TaxID=2161824 RepID=A0A369Q5W3_9SPHN|nr:carbonic anhydrase family protein [Alteripontixanthobacter maritimus]RDC59820.1 Carbonate dehydratase [Alteripontixanthobacter maritimus]
MKFKTAIAAASLTALSAAGIATGAAAADGQLDWKYTDGMTAERWSNANSDYAACDAGAMQSPIELDQASAIGDVKLSAAYGNAAGKLAIGTHKVQVDTPTGQGMISGDRLFNLLQVHFHTPSEHAVSGKRYPLTAHLVHATSDGTLGVLGIMFEAGAANPALQNIVDAMPRGNGGDVTVDMSDMVPADLSVHRYMGSLTTPPCSENVNWHVAETVMTASPAQIAAFEGALGMTARSLQPLNNRLLVAPSK